MGGEVALGAGVPLFLFFCFFFFDCGGGGGGAMLYSRCVCAVNVGIVVVGRWEKRSAPRSSITAKSMQWHANERGP